MDIASQIVLVVVIGVFIVAGYIWIQNKDVQKRGLSDELEQRQSNEPTNEQLNYTTDFNIHAPGKEEAVNEQSGVVEAIKEKQSANPIVEAIKNKNATSPVVKAIKERKDLDV